MDLLYEWMDEQQRRDFDEFGHFYVITENRLVFRLSTGKYVTQMQDGCAWIDYNVWACAEDEDYYGDDLLPPHDSALTQMLFLQTSPNWFLVQGCTQSARRSENDNCPPMRGEHAL